jgi:hypothetical protein
MRNVAPMSYFRATDSKCAAQSPNAAASARSNQTAPHLRHKMVTKINAAASPAGRARRAGIVFMPIATAAMKPYIDRIRDLA